MTTIWGMQDRSHGMPSQGNQLHPLRTVKSCVCVFVCISVCIIRCVFLFASTYISSIHESMWQRHIFVSFVVHMPSYDCEWVCVCVFVFVITGEFTALEISLLVQLSFSNWKLQRRTFRFPSQTEEEQACVCVMINCILCVWPLSRWVLLTKVQRQGGYKLKILHQDEIRDVS